MAFDDFMSATDGADTMTMSWKSHSPVRVDRYIDFEKVSALSNHDKDAWCPVSLTVRSDQPGANLLALLRLVDNDSYIKMTPDEYARLKASANAPTSDASRLDYYVYMHESKAYSGDAFADTSLYEISFVGSPIPSLVFNENMTSRALRLRAGKVEPTKVAIGVIDDGIAFANQRFRTSDAKQTRLSAVWLQDVERFEDGDDEPGSSECISFGRILDAQDINTLLENSNFDEREVYRRTGQLDFASHQRKPLAFRASHGTHVMDLAVGAPPKPGEPEPALFAVQVPPRLIAESFGASIGSYVLQAFRQIMLWADQVQDDVPLIINFSFGNFAGPKDGFGLIEKEISRLVAKRNAAGAPTIAVLPAGNSYRLRITARMNLDATGSKASVNSVDWILLPDDHTPNFLEIWLPEDNYAGTCSPIAISGMTGNGVDISVDMPNAGQAKLLMEGESVIGCLYFDLVKCEHGKVRPRYFIALNPTAALDGEHAVAPAGPWRISIENQSDAKLDIALYIQRDDTPYGIYPYGRQSYFDHDAAYARNETTGSYDALGAGPIVHEGSLSAIGNNPQQTLLVGAAQRSDAVIPSDYTSSGPTVSRQGPDFSVIVDESPVFRGHFAAGTFSGSTISISGTSIAAPQATRVIAGLISSGAVKNLDRDGLLEALHNTSIEAPVVINRLGKFVLPGIREKFEHIPRRRYSA